MYGLTKARITLGMHTSVSGSSWQPAFVAFHLSTARASAPRSMGGYVATSMDSLVGESRPKEFVDGGPHDVAMYETTESWKLGHGWSPPRAGGQCQGVLR